MSASGSTAAENNPLDATDFARLIAPLGPFERNPEIAVAVSGGPDSLALILLADGWARAQGGRAIALTVDHGLRPESAAEAAQVAAWLGARGIAHHTLAWAAPSGGAGLQARARAARHALLQDWCADHAVLHLLLAHHQDDQAETFLLRLGRGSGVDGLGAMVPVSHAAGCRLLRPLLDVPKARLVATCRAAGQAFVEDPSNRNPAFARVRLRAALPALGADGLAVRRLARTAAAMRRARAALDQATADLLARAASPHPGGFCRLDRAALAGAPHELALRALAAVLGSVGGAGYRPRLDALERLLAGLGAPSDGARTLQGCRVVARGAGIWVVREAAAMAPPVPLTAGGAVQWDRRFVVRAGARLPAGVTVGGLGTDAGTGLRELARGAIPAIGLPGLPAIRDLDGVLAVPHLNYCRQGYRVDTISRLSVLPDPAMALAGTGGLAEPGGIDIGR
ncbi:MAG: tRNA lysidine(34) synthetase TilS [Alphaproteobacteria bacterium]|nr:tRNA lysidine(34) synthetase TilS [Alphaproteobacteria bacterium]